MPRLGMLLVLVALVGCGGASATATPAFARYQAADAVAAFKAAGLSVDNVRPGTPWKQGDPWPNVATDRQVFDIASVAPNGGVIQTFAEQKDLDAMAAYYARFPDLAPYVYTKGNILVQLNSGVAKVEAERYRAALAAMK
jgi:hypothetical protein